MKKLIVVLIAFLALAVFKPPLIAYAIEKTGTEIFNCDVINFDVDSIIIEPWNCVVMVEVEISPGDCLNKLNYTTKKDSKLFDAVILQTALLYGTNYFLELTEENNISNGKNEIYRMVESKEVIGILPRYNQENIRI